MFDKLVNSGATQHRKRTSGFFIATSIIYLSVLAAAFAISVLITTPKMADSGYSSKADLIAPVAEPPQGIAPREAARAQPTPQGAPAEPGLPDDVIESREAAGGSQYNRPGPPAIGQINAGAGGYGESPFIGDLSIPIGPEGGDAKEGRLTHEPLKPAAPVERQVAERVTPKLVKVSSEVLQGKALDRDKPDYPELAKRAGVHGPVVVEVVIAESGHVESARAMGGHPLLIRPSLMAARRWRFAPTLLNGQPVKVTGLITFNFRLNE